MRTRAERRHHRKRMIDRVKNFNWLKPSFWGLSEDERLHKISKLADNRHPCSCSMCRNQRHSDWLNNKEKLTMQERRASEPIDED